MKVRDLMTDRVFSLTESDQLFDARELMWDLNVRHIPVVDDERELVGVFSHRDLVRWTGASETTSLTEREETLRRTAVGDVMTRDVETVGPEDDLRAAATSMVEGKYGCLPVVEGRRLVGILTESDFVRLFAEGN